MDNLSGVSVFVQAAETLSFVEAGRVLGISASAVGKASPAWKIGWMHACSTAARAA